MKNKTEGVKALAEEVLASIPLPHTEDIIEEVFVQIEKTPRWKTQHEELSAYLGQKWIVNNWLGKYTQLITGYKTGKQSNAKRTNLITSYSKLII